MTGYRLYLHPESDSLFWDEFCADPLAEDVTDDPRARLMAEQRGIPEPEDIAEVISEGKTKRVQGYDGKWRDIPISANTSGRDADMKGFAQAIVKSYKKWDRKPADLYPTPVDGTESLIPVLKAMKRPDGSPIKTIWEPACGDGRLARVLEWHGFEVISTDLRQYPGYGFGGLDFLCETPQDKWGWRTGDIDAIVTNPPFSLAEEFIRRAMLFTPNVAMLLKQTFWNVGGRSRGLWFDHMPDLELKLTWRLAFLASERGNSPLMDCMWAVWDGDNATLPLRSEAVPRRLDGGKILKHCITEPMPRLKYPGYGGIGLAAATQVLEGEMDALCKALEGLRGSDT